MEDVKNVHLGLSSLLMENVNWLTCSAEPTIKVMDLAFLAIQLLDSKIRSVLRILGLNLKIHIVVNF